MTRSLLLTYDMGRTLLNLLVFIVLAATLASPVVLWDKFQEYGPELLSNTTFVRNGEGWVVQGKADSGVSFNTTGVQIISTDGDSSFSVYQQLPPNPEFPFLRLQGDLAVQNVVPGEESWNKARLLLVQYVDGKARYQTPHSVIALDGTRPWQHYQKHFTIAPETESFRVVIQVSRATGMLQAKDISLRPIQKSSWYKGLEYPARICLYLFLLYLIFPYLRKQNNLLLSPLLCIVVLTIIIAISLPATTKNSLKNSVEDGAKQVATTFKNTKQQALPITLPIKIDSTKIGHFAFFVLLGLLLHAAQPDRKTRWILVDIILFAGTTEIIQLYIDGRGALLADALIDCGGGFLGVGIGMKRRKAKGGKLNQ